MEVDKSMLESLTEEERRLVEQAGSAKDLVELAQKSGVTLTDEQLDAIAGGGGDSWSDHRKCPQCGSNKIRVAAQATCFVCEECSYSWHH